MYAEAASTTPPSISLLNRFGTGRSARQNTAGHMRSPRPTSPEQALVLVSPVSIRENSSADRVPRHLTANGVSCDHLRTQRRLFKYTGFNPARCQSRAAFVPSVVHRQLFRVQRPQNYFTFPLTSSNRGHHHRTIIVVMSLFHVMPAQTG